MINGIVAVPVMAMMMVMTASHEVMGEFRLRGLLRLAGWVATAIMAAAAVGMCTTALI